MALSLNEKYLLLGILAAIMSFVVIFELRVIRGKNKDRRMASLRKDEAHNAILTTRTVINVMQRQGKDTSASERYVTSAKQSLQMGNLDRCLELCEKARAELTNPSSSKRKRETLETPFEEGGEKDRFEEVAESILSGGSRTRKSSPDMYAGTKLPADRDGNFMGAKFEVSAAKGEIGRAVHRGIDTSVAQDMLTQAESELSGGNYSKALSLALKARKSIGSDAVADTIPLRVKKEPEEPEAEPSSDESSAPEGALCNVCGAPLESDDEFCHKCGNKILKERRCASCGTKPRPTDMFCRKCGARID